MIERWLPVIGYETYYLVSDQGRVWSIRSKRLLSLSVGRRGYVHVRLSVEGVAATKKVHRLVLEAFVGPCPPGLVTCHANDVHHDNRLTNLRWDTHSANHHDMVRNGKHHNASKTRCKNGHDYTPKNTRVLTHTQQGYRRCRQCDRDQRQQRRRKAAA